MKTFAEFWPFYLGEHAKPATRWLHFIGSWAGLGFAVAAIVTHLWWLLLGAFVSGYLFAWIGHFGVEKNRPATFKHPFWSFAADWRMWALMLTGRLDRELGKHGISANGRSSSTVAHSR